MFGEVAREYARWRPTYPADAVSWLTGDAQLVVDLGAGTGQLTGQLLDRGLTVHAVERDPRMLAVLAERLPTARTHLSGADRIPLPDAHVDAVLSADAWHWFPAEATMAEVRRVLRPGGWLGLVWNTVKPLHPWEFELAGIDPDRKGVQDEPDTVPLEALLPGVETSVATFPWDWPVTPRQFRGYLATNSAMIRADDATRRRTLDSAEAIVAGVCAATGAQAAPLHHEAYCVRWVPDQA